MQGLAYVFINFVQAANLGHVGWGFAISDGQFCYGSTDHLWRRQFPQWHPLELIRYMQVPAAGNNDFWCEIAGAEEMLHNMRCGNHVRYHAYKVIPVESANPASTLELSRTMSRNGWMVINNNCIHQTHKVLSAYGTNLPAPNAWRNRIPKAWFENIPGQMKMLT